MTAIRCNMKALFFAALCCMMMNLSCNKEPQPSETPGEQPADPAEIESLVAVNVEKISRVIGPTPKGETCVNPNNTMKRFGIGSTDYGNMWDDGTGRLWCMFGDNFDDRGGNWRSNAVAFSTDRNLRDGLYYDEMLRGEDGKVMEFITSRAKTGQNPDGSEYEVTCIPLGGVSVPHGGGNRQYVHYMSVNQWATDGADSWRVNYSEIVYSDDYGKTWTRSGVKWGADSRFAQVSYLKVDDDLYMYGTPAGRKDNVYLAKVPQDKVLDKSAYKYWDGASWSSDESKAEAVANGYVSELTVQYNSHFKRYMMMYLSVNQRKLVFRDAASPEGEWSAEKIVLNDGYGPYIHPWFCDGEDLWFVLSSVNRKSGADYDTWHIHLYHAALEGDPEGMNMVWEGGFENEPNESISYKTLWNISNSTSTRDAHSGKIACRLSNPNDGVWKDACTQTIKVHKNTDYVLTGWAKTSLDEYQQTYLGVRLADGKVIDTNPKLSSTEWTLITKEFNSGNNTALDVFFGTWGISGLNVTIDDIKLTPLNK